MFLAGQQDIVMKILGITETSQLERMMAPVVPDLRSAELLPDTGHWIQQERPEEVNTALLGFLRSLSSAAASPHSRLTKRPAPPPLR